MVNSLDSGDTEKRILDAARNVFLKKGMYGARMQEIADEAGINKALLHYYFRSKDKLFEAIFLESFKEFVPKAFDIFKLDISFEDKIRHFVSSYVDKISENPFLPIFIINEINQNPQRIHHVTNMLGVIMKEISKDIKAKVESGEYREVDPVQLFSSIIAMILFPFLTRPIIQGAFSLTDEAYKQFLDERKKLVPDIILSYLKTKD